MSIGFRFVPSELSLSDYLDFWLEEYCKINLKPSTIEGYEKIIRVHIKPALGRYPLKGLSVSALQAFINRKFNDGYSRNTLVSMKKVLSGALSYAVSTAEYIQTNPMVKVKLPSFRAIANTPTRERPNHYITREQIRIIFERFPEGSPYYIPMMIAYKCGLRLGETYGLYWEDIDLEKETLTVNRQMQWSNTDSVWYMTKPKYNSVRTIKIDKDLARLLAREKVRQRKSEEYYNELYVKQYISEKDILNTDGLGTEIHPVMRRENGTYITPRTMLHASEIIHYKLGIKEFSFHSFRHTHATMLVEANVSMKYAQERLGHKDASVTMQVYQHVSEKMKQIGDNIINEMFG